MADDGGNRPDISAEDERDGVRAAGRPENTTESPDTEERPAYALGGDHDDDDPDVIAAKRRKRMQQFGQSHQAQAGFGAAAGRDGEGESGDNDRPDMEEERMRGERTLSGRIGHRALGVVTKNNEIDVNPDSRGQVSDRQIKAMIKVAVLEKGWDKLYFYDRKSGNIDPNMTSRANNLLETMQRRGEMPREIQFSMKPQDVRPWQNFQGTRQKLADFKKDVEYKTDQSIDSISRPFREASHGVAWRDARRPAAESNTGAEERRDQTGAAMRGAGGAPPSTPS